MGKNMNRREFLKYGTCGLAAIGVGGVGIPGYFRRAHAQTPLTEVRNTLRLAMEEAMFEMVDGLQIYHWAFRDPAGNMVRIQELS